MPEWLIVVLAIVIGLGIGLVYLRSRGEGPLASQSAATRDYDDERETDRLGGMSAEDREWEAASLERNRQAEERGKQPPA